MSVSSRARSISQVASMRACLRMKGRFEASGAAVLDDTLQTDRESLPRRFVESARCVGARTARVLPTFRRAGIGEGRSGREVRLGIRLDSRGPGPKLIDTRVPCRERH